MIKPEAIVCLAVLGALVAALANYWLTRLAVRGGIEDATRRERARATPPVWNLQNPAHQAEKASTDPQQGPVT